MKHSLKTLRSFTLAILAASMTVLLGADAAEATKRLERTLDVGGEKRSYILHLPDDLSAKSEWPVMVVYHPALGTAKGMEEITRMAQVAGKHFIIAFPDGFRRTFNAGDCCGLAERNNIDDVGFFKAIMQDAASMAKIKPKAYLTGYSNGARMVYHLVCTNPELVAAAAPFGATRDMSNCKSGQVPLLHIHGDADEGSPLEGGYAKSALLRNSLGYMEPAADTVAKVASRNGCFSRSGATEEIADLGTVCRKYSSCNGGEATLCVIPGLGHIWPGSSEGSRRFGPARGDLNGSRAVANFFLRH